jgi:hypothetical protein
MAKNDSKVVALKAIRASQNENESLRIVSAAMFIPRQLSVIADHNLVSSSARRPLLGNSYAIHTLCLFLASSGHQVLHKQSNSLASG